MLTNSAIFPLPELILFPGTFLPLHIFETRYRLLLDYSIESDFEIGISFFRVDGSVEPLVGWGRVIKIDSLPDGRSNILIQGDGMAKIKQYISTDPFIIARIQKLEPDLSYLKMDLFQEKLSKILAMARQFLIQSGVEPIFIAELNKLQNHSFPIEFLSSVLNISFTKKKELFLTLDPFTRAEKLEAILKNLLD